MDHAPPPRRIFLPVQWLISPRVDLLFILGSVFVAWAMFALWGYGVLTITGVILLWVFLFHGPHFWGTYARTYADREQYAKRKKELWLPSLAWFAIGPVFVGVGLLLRATTGRDELIQLFFFLAAVWAFHHVAKQHFGFLALYRAKHREFHRRDFMFHKYYLLVSLWMPALILLSNNINWAKELPGLARYYGSGPIAQEAVVNAQSFIYDAGTTIFWVAQALFVATMIQRVVSGRGINLPVLMLVLAAVPLNWIVIMACVHSTAPGGHFVLVPIITTYHNIQYHALIWHYNRTKYVARRHEKDAKQRFGFAMLCNRSFLLYALFGAAFTFATIGFEHYEWARVTDSEVGKQIFKAFFWGFAFHHYYLDSKIWHASEDAELRQILGFQGPKKRKPLHEIPTPLAEPVTPVAAATPPRSARA